MAAELKDFTMHGDKAKLVHMMNTLLQYAIKIVPMGSLISVTADVYEKPDAKMLLKNKSNKRQKYLKLTVFCPGNAWDSVSEGSSHHCR